MSNMKIISILDYDQRSQEVRVRAELGAAVKRLDFDIASLDNEMLRAEDEIIALRSDVDVAIQRLRNRIQDLTLRVTVLEGGSS